MSQAISLAISNDGTRVHTRVLSLPSPSQGKLPTSPDESANVVERQAAIENSLSMALYFIRQPGNIAANMWAATARANRALTLLKQASQGNAPASNANTQGRG